MEIIFLKTKVRCYNRFLFFFPFFFSHPSLEKKKKC